MFNQNLLKAKMVEKGKNALQIANYIGICECTFYRKMAKNGNFSRFEIQRIVEMLELSDKERDDIFFG